MQTKLAFTLNNIFKYVVIFCISFIWCNYYYPNFLGSVIIAVILTSIICFCLSKIFYTKKEKDNQKNLEKTKMVNTLNQLLFLTNTEILDYFILIFSKLNYTPKKHKTHIEIDNKIIIPIFNYELDVNTFLNTYKTTKLDNKTLIILTNKVSSELNSFLNNFDLSYIKFIIGSDVYNKLIKPSDTLPLNIVKPKTTVKLTFIKLCENAFNKRNSKSYFLSGVLVMFSSLFYKYGLYYQIIGTLLFSFSLYSRVNTRFNTPPSTNIFD